MSTLVMKFPEGRGKVLTFSYDDGVVQDKRFIELLDKYSLKGTFNLNSRVFFERDPNWTEYWCPLTLEEAKKTYVGHEVACHTYSHPFPHAISQTDMVMEVVRDREILEREFDTVVKGMAYPQGTYNDEIVEVLKVCGISYSRTVKATGNFTYPPENWLTLHPTAKHTDPRLFELADNFIGMGDRSLHPNNYMFYVWGHTYEFYRDNNWELIERFCEKMSGHNDIWYATNIEIYNYQKAFESLERSIDNSIIKNPTSTDIWALLDGKIIKIPAGEIYRK